MTIGRLHIVTDDGVLARPGFLDMAGVVLDAGGPAVTLHVRGHSTAGGTMFEVATRLLVRTRAVGARLLVNDRVDIALAADADGVQLGKRGLPTARIRRLVGSRLIGFSAHSAAESAAAAGAGADFVLAGTIHETPAHPGRAGGLGLLEACVAAAGVPVVAIGGVTPGRVRPIMDAGAAGVAVRGGVWDVAEPGVAVTRFVQMLDGH